MYLCYLDESGDPGKDGSSHLILGAAVLFEGQWNNVLRDLETLITKHFPAQPRPTELHLADLRSGKGLYRTLSKAQRDALIADYCQLVTRLLPTELRLFTIIADKAWWFGRNPGKTGDDLYSELFEHLCSRFDLFLRRRYAQLAPTKGIMVADPHKPDLTKALKAKHRSFQRSGTRWAQLYNVIETVFFLSSHESPGIQIADLCSFAVWRLVTAGDASIVSRIAVAFDREPPGSEINPGKWHGVKYLGSDPVVQGRISSVWASF